MIGLPMGGGKEHTTQKVNQGRDPRKEALYEQ